MGDVRDTAYTYKVVVPFDCPIASVEPGGKRCASTNAAMSADHSVVAASASQLPHRVEHAQTHTSAHPLRSVRRR
jgi:hypothetical protein